MTNIITNRGGDKIEHQENQSFYTVRGYQKLARLQGDLSPAMEDYLEMTARLCSENGFTRTGRISAALNVKPSSASKMISKLMDSGYLSFDANNCIYLTMSGKAISDYLLYRHETLELFFSAIGSEAPLKETELIEHYLSPQTINAIKKVLPLLQGSTPPEHGE